MTALDPTFRNYSSDQAASYASGRDGYSKSLYEHIVQYHISHGGGRFDMLVDVGCGTGNATRELAAFFDQVTGLDAGAEMIAQANVLGGLTRSGARIKYENVEAEELAQAHTIKVGKVDLLSSGMAAHWFRMKDFWTQADLILKPGGTIALWTHSSLYCHPSTPNALVVQQLLSYLEDVTLGPYELPENNMSRTMYERLVMPWDLDPPLPEFSRKDFMRMEWNRDGSLEAGQNDFFGGGEETTLAGLEQSLGTASMVTRWQEAHPQLVNTERDCVKETVGAIAEAMGQQFRSLDEICLRIAGSTVLLLLTKSSGLS